MYRYDDIRYVHLEPTMRCNAACPMCARNSRGVTAPGLGLTDMSLETVRTIFPEELLARLHGFELCGSYGDPAVARDLLEIVAYIRAASPDCLITAYTNGGIRPPQWWASLAKALASHSTVVFAIDGIGETNAVYRRRVDYDRVIDNARAFIEAGGDARWEFLLFRHNEHQVETARRLSEQIGFRDFVVKRSARFMDGLFDYVPELAGRDDLSQFPIYSADGAEAGVLEPPSDSKWTKVAAAEHAAAFRRDGPLADLVRTTPIHCRALDKKSVFVGAQGHAFPCPWTYVQATRPALSHFPATANWEVRYLLDACGGLDALAAGRLGLRAVIEGRFFAEVESRWSCDSGSEGRLQICARTCGVSVVAFMKTLGDHKTSLPLERR